MKKLLDALRVPKDPQEFKNATLAAGLHPCLLEDDAMITALHITTNRYLACPSTPPKHVRLLINASVLPAENDFINKARRKPREPAPALAWELSAMPCADSWPARPASGT